TPADAVVRGLAVERHRELARRRDREQVRGREVERERVGALGLLEVEPQGASVPGGRVHDRTPIRTESRPADVAAAEGQALEARRIRGSGPREEEPGAGGPEQEGGGGEGPPADAGPPSRS